MRTHEGAACRARWASKRIGVGEARPTAKDPNRRVNTLLTVLGEARKPNGIRFGDLVGGLRRPPAATTASARSYSLLLFFTTSILTSYSRRRGHQHEEAALFFLSFVDLHHPSRARVFNKERRTGDGIVTRRNTALIRWSIVSACNKKARHKHADNIPEQRTVVSGTDESRNEDSERYKDSHRKSTPTRFRVAPNAILPCPPLTLPVHRAWSLKTPSTQNKADVLYIKVTYRTPRNPVDYLLIKCLRFIGTPRPRHCTRQLQPAEPPSSSRTNQPTNQPTNRPPGATTPPPPAPIPGPGRDGTTCHTANSIILGSGNERRQESHIRTRARALAILIATQENEFSRSAELINAYLDAAF
ncbi:hypothetical protein ALC56_14427 [Trachymyrmex septentrionalis]|uniref:Uncharacterized protein n=1 Tax=Trachymyrmex septentrionalis TaxID=34720 RepID=A0A195ETR1_9HYME|nr:hypothetical protein ALC56_14427 [Trachymyrmex septentrionalis]